MRQQIQQWQIAVVNGQQISPPAGSQSSGQPPSSVWIQVPANGYYPPPSYPYPSYPLQQYPSPYSPPSYPPPSCPSSSYPPPSYPPPSYTQPSPYPQPPTTDIPELPSEASGVITPQPEVPVPESPVPEYSSSPAPENPSSKAPEYPSTPSSEQATPPPEIADPDIPEITQAPTDKPYPTTLKLEDQPTYPEKPSSENPGEEPEVTTSTGTTYSPDYEVPSSTGSPSSDVLKAQCKQPRGQFPSESSCNKFINCWDETAIEQTCPAGLVFNPEKSYCDYPSYVDCGSRPITVNETSNNTKCPDGYGTYRSKENCGAFYVCVAGSPVDFICPGGTYYNEDFKICDYPYRVDCKGLPSNPEPIETGTEVEPNTTYAPEVSSAGVTTEAQSSTASYVLLSSAESSPATEVVPTITTAVAPVVADPIAIYNYNLRKIPASLVNTGVRCSHKNIYRLTPDCSSVILCREGFTHILNCGHETSYDIVSQKCMESRRANCIFLPWYPGERVHRGTDWVASEHDVDYHNASVTGQRNINDIASLDDKAINNTVKECLSKDPLESSFLIGGLTGKQALENTYNQTVGFVFGDKAVYPTSSSTSKSTIDWFSTPKF
ncbi:Chitin binding domain [Cinara cedri]|uniref:Chitin binding domain n=1 Tax=Cinara cedri TaxID=506608 RepID=A0A5E4N620_9HEMI|nr:Chitin binding domain [Cinara cedri]